MTGREHGFRAGFLVLAAIASSVAGCASSSHSYFMPARTRGTALTMESAREIAEPVRTRGFVPADHATEPLRIGCAARLRTEAAAPGAYMSTLSVRVWVINYSNARVELRPSEFRVIDDLERPFALSSTALDGRETGVALIAPGRRVAVDLVFRRSAASADESESVRSLRLLWGFRIGDEEYRHETTFEPGGSERNYHHGPRPSLAARLSS